MKGTKVAKCSASAEELFFVPPEHTSISRRNLLSSGVSSFLNEQQNLSYILSLDKKKMPVCIFSFYTKIVIISNFTEIFFALVQLSNLNYVLDIIFLRFYIHFVSLKAMGHTCIRKNCNISIKTKLTKRIQNFLSLLLQFSSLGL